MVNIKAFTSVNVAPGQNTNVPDVVALANEIKSFGEPLFRESVGINL